MSVSIKLKSLSEKDQKKLSNDLRIVQESKYQGYQNFAKPVLVYDISKDGNIYIPFSYLNLKKPERKSFKSINVKFDGTLREEQELLKKEAITYLNENNSVVISAYPGFGKTCVSISIACRIKLKTLIISHRLLLIDQWEESIRKFSQDSTVKIIKKKSDLDDEADFYIINASMIGKLERADFKSFGFVIVDEAHLILSEKTNKCLLYLSPRYLLGLSATPYRPDSLNVLFNLYFGEKEIERKLSKTHHVYKYKTDFKIEHTLGQNGKIDWNSVINSQAYNEERNDLIVKILLFFKDLKFLVLCKRVEQVKTIVKKLKEKKETVTSLVGNKKEFDTNARILVGTSQKAGVGFDHESLDGLLLASDIQEYFIQYLGRVFRRENSEPIIIDIVDKFPLLEKHFAARKKVYLEHGGIISDFREKFGFN